MQKIKEERKVGNCANLPQVILKIHSTHSLDWSHVLLKMTLALQTPLLNSEQIQMAVAKFLVRIQWSNP